VAGVRIGVVTQASAPPGMPVQLVSLEEVVDACDRLARAILAHGMRPDSVVAIARGGFMPARFLCDFLGVTKLLSVKLRHYEAGGRKAGPVEVASPLSGGFAGNRVLLVDDVNDSGETLAAAVPYLQSMGPAWLRSAVLHEKATTRHRADFVAHSVREWRWILYPWAVVEDVGQFIRELQPPPRSLDAIRKGLEAWHGLRLSPAQLERVLRYDGLGPETA
jgi:uncharacterized protein